MKKRKNRWSRVIAAMLAVFLGMPSMVHAQTDIKAVRQIHHVHIGNQKEGGPCYEEEIKHIHQGNEEDGGSCFQSPVYHVHEGNEEEGGDCYRTEIYHVHEGTQEEGKGCYGRPVYHSHDGSAGTGGGCYGQPVYHAHRGNAGTGGGCYGKPVYHKHTGSQASKGGCYQTPVCHVHTGNKETGGGCYRTAVYHSHAGDEVSGGACYEPVYHQHTDSCYQEARCEMEYVGNFQVQREESGYCYHHGNALIMYFRANFRHQSCGRGVTEDGNSTCWTCQIMNSWHMYNKAVCGKDEKTVEGYRRVCGKETSTVESWALGCGKDNTTVEKYDLSCGKNDKTVDSYQINCNKNDKTVESYRTDCGKTEEHIEKYALNCGKTEESVDAYAMNCTKDEKTVDSYVLSCEKTEETTDSYGLSCEKDERKGFAEFSVSGQDGQWTREDVILKASLQDPDGFLQLPSEPFFWEGERIKKVLSHELKVKENGVYSLHLRAENADVDKKELVLSIEVKNIDKTAPSIEQIVYAKNAEIKDITIRVMAKDLQPDGSPGSGLAEKAYSFDGGKTWQKENTWKMETSGILSVAVRDGCGNISVQKVKIVGIEETDNKSGEEKEEQPKEHPDSGSDRISGEEQKREEQKGEELTGEENNSSKNKKKGKNNTDKEDGDEKDIKDIDKKDGDKEENILPQKAGASKRTGEDGKRKGETAGKERKKPVNRAEADKRKITFPEKKEEYQEEMILVEVPETGAEPENNGRMEILARAEAAGKVVKAVTFTVSGIMLASGLIYLIYLMFRSIQIFDCDGEGNVRYAGSCIMKKTENGFEVKIPNMIWESSETGQYVLRPGKMFAGKNKGKELIVMAGESRESVWIDKEIPLRMYKIQRNEY